MVVEQLEGEANLFLHPWFTSPPGAGGGSWAGEPSMSRAQFFLQATAVVIVIIAALSYIVAQNVVYQTFTAQGISMKPTILPGDTVMVETEPWAGPAHTGQIVTFWCQGEHFGNQSYYNCGSGFYVTHRVIAENSTHLLTKGDANPYPDWWIQRSEIHGIVVQISHTGGFLSRGLPETASLIFL